MASMSAEDTAEDTMADTSDNSSSSLTISSRDDTQSVKFNDHAINSLARMNNFMQSRILTDVILHVGYLDIPAHRVVLSASSDYFYAMFTGGLRECGQEVVPMYGVEPEAMRIIVEFCYTGEIELTDDNVESVLRAAHLFHMVDLITVSTKFLFRNLHYSNCIGIYKFAEFHLSPEMKNIAEEYIAEHFSLVQTTDEFLELPAADLAQLIASDSINVTSEEDIYSAVIKWVYCDLYTRKESAALLLKHIKLPLLPQAFLIDVVEKEKIFREDIKCRQLIMEAISYHLLPNRRGVMQSSRSLPRPSTLEKVYVLGGATKKGSMNIEIFDIRANTWKSVGHMRNKRLQFGAAVLHGRIHVVGGRDGLKTVNTFECLSKQPLNDETDMVTWSNLPPMLTNRHGLGVGVVGPNGPLYTVGGHDGWSYLNTAERWDPRMRIWSFIAPMLSARSTAGIAMTDNRMYAIGGRDGASCLRSVESYDPYTNTWYFCSPMTKRRAGISAVALNGCIYVVGGHEGATRYNCMERYDPREDRWTQVAPLSVGRDGISVAVLGNRFIAIGGYDGNCYQNTVELYDPCKDAWSPLSPLNFGRAGACALPIPNLAMLDPEYYSSS